MNEIKITWPKAIITDTIFYGLLIGWLFFGISGLGNLFIFATSILTLMLLCLCFSEKYINLQNEKTIIYPKGFRTYHTSTDLIALSLLVFYGHIFVGIIYLLKMVLGFILRTHSKIE